MWCSKSGDDLLADLAKFVNLLKRYENFKIKIIWKIILYYYHKKKSDLKWSVFLLKCGVFYFQYICIENTTFPSIQGFSDNVTTCHHQFLHHHISFLSMYLEEGFLEFRWRWESFQSLLEAYPHTWKKNPVYIYKATMGTHPQEVQSQ
jgi:hypothetical protein